MTDVDYGKALVEQNRLMGEVLRDADWSTPVPSCPGWTVLQVLKHVGRGDRWAAQIIGEGGGEVDPRQVPDGRPPNDATGAIEWLSAGPLTLGEAVATSGPNTPAWTFLGAKPAAWWVRRRLHEATVHRADVALALGRSYELEPVLAADGVTEWLALAAGLSGADATIVLRATDTADEWTVEGPSPEPAVTLRGGATDVLLALTGRTSVSELEVVGDQQVWISWTERMNF